MKKNKTFYYFFLKAVLFLKIRNSNCLILNYNLQKYAPVLPNKMIRGNKMVLWLQKQNIDTVDVAIVGAGIGGTALAAGLCAKGHNVLLFEKTACVTEGGSAIGMWTQAWRALDHLGVGDSLRKGRNPGTTLKIVDNTGKQLAGFNLNECDKGPHEFRYIMRSDLVRELLSKVPESQILYNSKLKSISKTDSGLHLVSFENGDSVHAKVVVGADGINSFVRSQIKPIDGKPNYAGYKAFRGISSCSPNFETIDGQTIYQIWGKGTRMGINRMSPTEIYWFITYNSPEDLDDEERDPVKRKRKALQLVKGWASSLAAEEIILQTLPETILVGSIRDRWPNTEPWGRECVTLIGDAAHPMTPNLAQGGAAALEDAVELTALLSNTLGNPLLDQKPVEETLRKFEMKRISRLAKLSLKSYAFGALLQLPFAPVTFIRNNIALPILFQINYLPRTFLDHTDWQP